MFKKIVSNLPFSPALIGALSTYAATLRGNYPLRLTGFVALSCMFGIQFIISTYPPEAVNTTTTNDIATGGITSKESFLQLYATNENKLRSIVDAANITQYDLQLASPVTFPAGELLVLSRQPQVGTQQDELPYTVDGITLYQRPLANLLHTTKDSVFNGWGGTSPSAGRFAILQDSGDIVLQRPLSQPESLKPIVTSVSSINASRGNIPAQKEIALSEDRIIYTVNLTNQTDEPHSLTPSIHISDILEYAELADSGGAHLDTMTGTLLWSPTTLQPGEVQHRTFSIHTLSPIPATASGVSNPHSYDCVMTVVESNALHIPIQCPFEKSIENTVHSLPAMPSYVALLISGCLMFISLFLLLRNRQLQKEVRMIRHNLSQGAL